MFSPLCYFNVIITYSRLFVNNKLYPAISETIYLTLSIDKFATTLKINIVTHINSNFSVNQVYIPIKKQKTDYTTVSSCNIIRSMFTNIIFNFSFWTWPLFLYLCLLLLFELMRTKASHQTRLLVCHYFLSFQ